jgi:predicted lipid-binding transport protein (Tim44 family)
MAYQEQQAESRRVVVETPQARREEVHSESVRYPERSGISGAALAAIVVGVIVLATIVILFVMNQNRQDEMTAEAAQQQQQPQTIVQQPAQQPPVIVQQPAPATQPAPVIITQTAPATGGSSGPDDSSIQASVDKRLYDDPELKPLGITTIVLDGKATLTGTVKTEAIKSQVERAVKSVRGVKSVDNQLSVVG